MKSLTNPHTGKGRSADPKFLRPFAERVDVFVVERNGQTHARDPELP